MDKKGLDNQELEQVNGGFEGTDNVWYRCPQCNGRYLQEKQYPDGWMYKVTGNFCHSTYYLKCPNCGYETHYSL